MQLIKRLPYVVLRRTKKETVKSRNDAAYYPNDDPYVASSLVAASCRDVYPSMVFRSGHWRRSRSKQQRKTENAVHFGARTLNVYIQQPAAARSSLLQQAS